MSKKKHGGPMGGGPMVVTEKAKDFKGTMKNLMEYLSPYKIAMILVFILAIGSTAFSIVGPKLLGKATTEIFNGLISKVTSSGNGSIDFGYIGKIAIGLVALYVVSTILSFAQGFIMSNIAQKVSYNLRKEISNKINKMPLKYFDKTTHGEVLSRITNDVDTVNTTLNQSLSQIITSVTMLIGVIIMMFVSNTN